MSAKQVLISFLSVPKLYKRWFASQDTLLGEHSYYLTSISVKLVSQQATWLDEDSYITIFVQRKSLSEG